MIQKNNRQAERDLCVKNRGLVEKYASQFNKQFKNRLGFEDLIQVGMIGMLKAAKKFDFDKGTQFSTYAVWYILQSIQREIIDTGFIIRLPVHMFDKIMRARRLYEKFFCSGKIIRSV